MKFHKVFYKPNPSFVDYELNITGWLDGDTIVSFTATATGVTIDELKTTSTDSTITVWVSGYRGEITFSIITAAGREIPFKMIFKEGC